MLKIGIVGKKDSNKIIETLSIANNVKLSGVFSPDFQFKIPDTFQKYPCFLSFEELIIKSDAIIFSSTEDILFPLIEMTVKYSKHILIKDSFNLTYKELSILQKLSEESGSIIHFMNNFIYSPLSTHLKNSAPPPMVTEFSITSKQESQLIHNLSSAVSYILFLHKSNIRCVTVNSYCSLSQIPDILKTRIDFNNGSIADIKITVGDKRQSTELKYYGYNCNIDLNFTKNGMTGVANKETIKKSTSNKTPLIKNHLSMFCESIISGTSCHNNIELEIQTKKITDFAIEKLSLNINLL